MIHFPGSSCGLILSHHVIFHMLWVPPVECEWKLERGSDRSHTHSAWHSPKGCLITQFVTLSKKHRARLHALSPPAAGYLLGTLLVSNSRVNQSQAQLPAAQTTPTCTHTHIVHTATHMIQYMWKQAWHMQNLWGRDTYLFSVYWCGRSNNILHSTMLYKTSSRL